MRSKEQLLKAAKVLDRASRIIKGHFTKRTLVDEAYGEEGASYCALGSIRQAHTEIEGVPLGSYDIYTVRENSAGIARRAVYEVVRNLYHSSIPCFNDRRDTTEEDVIRVMKQAARNLRKEAGVETKKRVKKKTLDASKYFLKHGSKASSSQVSSSK